jgi:hypothetical protein
MASPLLLWMLNGADSTGLHAGGGVDATMGCPRRCSSVRKMWLVTAPKAAPVRS